MGGKRLKKMRPKRKGPNNIKSHTSNNVNQAAIDYYQPVFAHYHDEILKNSKIIEYIDDISSLREKFWGLTLYPNNYRPDYGWQLVKTYLDLVEKNMAEIVSKHSIYYWIHLYRRIGVSHPKGGDDIKTTFLVRNIMEASFIKYGKICEIEDMVRTIDIVPSQLLGGELFRLGFVDFAKHYCEHRRWVIKEMSFESFIEIYKLETLAYEYWFCTSVLRSIGKGAELRVSGATNFGSLPDKELYLTLIALGPKR